MKSILKKNKKGGNRFFNNRSTQQPTQGGTETPIWKNSIFLGSVIVIVVIVVIGASTNWFGTTTDSDKTKKTDSDKTKKTDSDKTKKTDSDKTKKTDSDKTPVDCVEGNGGEWSTCNLECGGGTQTRERTGDKHALWGGKLCPSTSEIQDCNTHDCPVDCVVGNGGDWSTCSVECGGGNQIRERTGDTPAQYDGKPCPSTSEERVCNTHNCPVDCVEGDWGEWSTCSVECGGGTQTRVRTVVTPAQYDGKPCPSTSETQACNTVNCSDLFTKELYITVREYEKSHGGQKIFEEKPSDINTIARTIKVIPDNEDSPSNLQRYRVNSDENIEPIRNYETSTGRFTFRAISEEQKNQLYNNTTGLNPLNVYRRSYWSNKKKYYEYRFYNDTNTNYKGSVYNINKRWYHQRILYVKDV